MVFFYQNLMKWTNIINFFYQTFFSLISNIIFEFILMKRKSLKAIKDKTRKNLEEI